MPISFIRPLCLIAAVAVSGFVFGYVGEAAAIDRSPAVGGVGSSGSRGYGAERPGYGAEREYYGASNLRPASNGSLYRDGDRYRSEGSVIEFGDGYVDGIEEGYDADRYGSRAGVYPGFGSNTGGSIVYLDDGQAGPYEGPNVTSPSGPRIIDVEAERLDRRPVEAGGVSVSYVGGAKIIRIGAGGRQHSEARPALVPWSESWDRYCRRAYPDFDPDRGTYTAKDGSTRFCTGG